MSVAGELGDDHEEEDEAMMDWGGVETDASAIELGEGAFMWFWFALLFLLMFARRGCCERIIHEIGEGLCVAPSIGAEGRAADLLLELCRTRSLQPERQSPKFVAISSIWMPAPSRVWWM